MLESKQIKEDRVSEIEARAKEIAHEINNPLAIIKTKAYLLKKNPKDLEKSLETMSLMADRISALVKEMEECVRNAAHQN